MMPRLFIVCSVVEKFGVRHNFRAYQVTKSLGGKKLGGDLLFWFHSRSIVSKAMICSVRISVVSISNVRLFHQLLIFLFRPFFSIDEPTNTLVFSLGHHNTATHVLAVPGRTVPASQQTH